MSDFIDESLLKDFFDEAYIQLSIIEENLLILEKDKRNKEAIDAIFRAAHTLKGNSAAVNMEEISKVTHALEDAVDMVRKEKVVLDTKKVDFLLDVLDLIKNMVDLRNSGTVYNKDYSTLLDKLANFDKLEGGKKVGMSKEQKKEEKSDIDVSKFKLTEYDLFELKEANHDNLPLYKVIVTFDESNPMRTVGGVQVFTSLREIGIVFKTVPDFEVIYSDVFQKEVMYIVGTKRKKEEIEEFATIPDTTEKVYVEPIELDKLLGKADIKGKQKGNEIDSIDKKIDNIKNEIVENVKKEIKSQIMEEEVESEEKEDIKSKYIEEKFATKTSLKEDIKEQKTTTVLRVDAEKIDSLLNLVSEVVINKAAHTQTFISFNQLFDNFSFVNNGYKDSLKLFVSKIYELIENKERISDIDSFKGEIQHIYKELYAKFDPIVGQFKNIMTKFKTDNLNLDRISSSLQEGVMRVRMVPINQIFSRFPRMVRDLCKDLKKNIKLVINGEDTEIDKAMIDYLMDPLIHMVRNAIDHGIENDDERMKIGKPIPATLELSAVSQGNIISISVADDGRGIEPEKIRKKAIELGLIDKDAELKEAELYNLIFEPGFSTSDRVTSISGRGVGLDVVKKNIEKLNGTIKVESEVGMGTIFTIKIPLTLAIIQGLLVRVDENIYAIPVSSVLESMRIKKEEIKILDNYEVINIRDEVISLLRINRIFKSGPDKIEDFYYIVIVGSQEKKVALLVDSIVGEDDIVIKPLKDKYTATPGISGATILGDGTVSLILDIAQLIELGFKLESENRRV